MGFTNIILQFFPDSRTASDRARAEAARKDIEDLVAQAQSIVDNANYVTIEDSESTDIDFARPKVFNSPGNPRTGNITEDLTGAVIGVVQKVYHNDASSPSFPPGWVEMSNTQGYVTGVLNIIHCEWVAESRVEYWIEQEA